MGREDRAGHVDATPMAVPGPVPNFRNWKAGKGAKPNCLNVQVQAQGYLIRREDYIAVTRVGLGGWLDRNSPRPTS